MLQFMLEGIFSSAETNCLWSLSLFISPSVSPCVVWMFSWWVNMNLVTQHKIQAVPSHSKIHHLWHTYVRPFHKNGTSQCCPRAQVYAFRSRLHAISVVSLGMMYLKQIKMMLFRLLCDTQCSSLSLLFLSSMFRS